MRMNEIRILKPFDLKKTSWSELLDAMQEFRRHIHQHPETKWEEKETSKLIRKTLELYGVKWRKCAGLGTIATMGEDLSGEHIALRGDIDALPLNEESGVKWSSKNDGKMHACGHDGHTATLMMTVLWIKKNESQLNGPVSFFFQPAEEGGHGAHEMIKDGALQGIDKVFGWHNWPALPFGQAVCGAGPIMSANGTFEIDVKGQGGHSSQPEKCKDPVLAASAVVINLNQIIAKRLPPQSAAVVSVTSFEAPSFETIIPDKATLKGSIRVSDTKMRDHVFELIKEIAHQTAQSYGVEAKTQTRPRYNATVNTHKEAELYQRIFKEVFGEDHHPQNFPLPIMASEDFSYYLEEVKGAFALIGADDGEKNHGVACHNTTYDFNDKLIEKMTQVFLKIIKLST